MPVFGRATTWTTSSMTLGLDGQTEASPEEGKPERLEICSDDSREVSGTFPSPRASKSLCEQFWDFDLCAQLPRKLTRDGVEAVRGELGRIRDFLSEQFPSLTEEALSGRRGAPLATIKQTYLANHCDLIELRHNGKTVGAIVGAPEDWSSYYVRIYALAPGYQRPLLTRSFGRECLLEPLRAHHIERVVADVSPANIAMARGLCEMQFHITGHTLSERWGAMVRYTHFLDARCQKAFMKMFAGTAPPRSRGTRKEDIP
jgi:hypothetical protein